MRSRQEGLVVYRGEPEQYIAIITPDACAALKDSTLLFIEGALVRPKISLDTRYTFENVNLTVEEPIYTSVP
jgi:hypothetical protein